MGPKNVVENGCHILSNNVETKTNMSENSFKMRWNCGREKKFVERCQQHPFLFDVSLRDHLDRANKDASNPMENTLPTNIQYMHNVYQTIPWELLN